MANEVNANININLDTSQALSSLRTLQNQISTFNQSLIASNTAAVASQRSMISTLTAQIGATKAFSTQMVSVESSVSRLGTAIDKNKLSLGEYFRYGVASSKNFGRVFGREHAQVMDLAADRVKRLQTQYIAMGAAQDGMTRAMAVRPLHLFNADVAIATQRQQLFNKLLDSGSTGLINFGKNTQWAGRQLMVGFTVPLTIFGGVAGKIFMDLERQVVNFRRVYGDAMTPSGETDQMVQEIQTLGKEFTKYGITVKDTVGLAGDIAATGAQGADLVAATAQSTRLATLGMIDMNQAMSATISLQTAFKLSNDELAQSVDFLNAVENQTVLSLNDVTEAIPRVAPIIKGLGGDVQDLAIFLTAMREGGVSASEGANALKSGLASLINPTKAAYTQLDKVGISIDSILSRNKGDIRAIVTEFGAALGTLDKFERQQTLAKVFGKYQFARLGALFENISAEGSQASRVIDLTGQSFEQLGELAEKELTAIEESVGMKFTGAVERAKLALAPIGEVFLKVATPIIDVVTKILEKFNELSPGVKQFATILVAGLGVVVPTVVMLIGLFANFAGQAIRGGALLNNLFNRIRSGGGSFDYLTTQELDAAAAAASLEGQTTSLTGALNIQRQAVGNLARAYKGYVASAQAAATGLPSGFAGKPAKAMASGGMVGGTGNKDTEPALLTPGEFVMNRGATEKFGPILDAMNRGSISQLNDGSRFKVPAYAETAIRLQSGKENMARKASSLITEEVLSFLALRVGEARGMVPSQSQVSRGAFDPVAQELAPIASNFVQRVNSHFDETFKDIKDSNERMSQSWKRAGQEMSSTVESLPDVDKAVVQRYMGMTEDVYATIPTAPRREGDAELSRARKSAYLRGAGKPRSYRDLGTPTRSMFQRLTGKSAEGMQLGHALSENTIDLDLRELAKDPNASSAVKTAMSNLGKVGSEAMAETIAKSDPTGRGLALEEGRNSPHRQAKQNAKEDATAYVDTYSKTVESGLSGKRSATRSQGPAGLTSQEIDAEIRRQSREERRRRGPVVRPGTLDPRSLRQGEESTRIANIGDAQDAARREQINRAHDEAIEENTRRMQGLSQENKGQTSKLKKFGNAITKGSIKLQGAMFALDGLVFATSMMDNSVGEFAQKILPAVFAFQGIAMTLPIVSGGIKALATAMGTTAAGLIGILGPVGLVAAALGGLAWVTKMQADKQNETIKANQKYIDATLGSAAAMTNFAKATNKQTILQREAALNMPTPSIGKRQKDFAEEFVESESGKEITESLKQISEGPERIAALRSQLIQAMAAGFLSPKQAKAVARQVSIELGDPIVGNSVITSIEMALTKNGKRLKGIASEIFAGTIQETVIPELKLIEDAAKNISRLPTAPPEGATGRPWLAKEAFKVTKEQGGAAFQAAATDATKLREAIALLNIDFDAGKIKQKDYEKQLKNLNDRFKQNIELIDGMGMSVKGGSDAVGGFFKNYAVMMGMTEEDFEKVEGSVSNIVSGLKDIPSTLETDLKFSVATGGLSLEQLSSLEALFNLEETGEKNKKEFELLLSAGGDYTPEQVTQFYLSIAGFPDEIRKTVQARFIENGLSDAQNYLYVLSSIMGLPPKLRNIIEPQILGAGIEGLKTAKYYLDYLNDIPAKQRKDYIIAVTQLTFRKTIGESLSNAEAAADRGSQRARSALLRGKRKGYSPSTGTDADAIAKDIQAKLDAVVAGIGGGDDGGGGGGGGDTGGGGSKELSWLEELFQEVDANFKLFVENVKKSGKSAMDQLRALKPSIPEQMLSMIGAGPEGLKRAAQLLNLDAKKRKELIQKWTKQSIGQTLDNLTSKRTAKVQSDTARSRLSNLTVDGRKVEADIIEEILKDEGAILTILKGSKKEINELVQGYRFIQDEQDPIKSAVEKIRKEHEKSVKIIDKEIKQQQKIVDAIQDQIEAIEEKNEKDEWSIRGKEREKELIDRQIEALDRSNELDQRRIDNLQREDELRNRISDSLSKELEIMSKQEDKIRKAYEERIDALDKVASINDHIINQQRNQLNLSNALSTGDIAAAAQAAQEMNAASAQFATQQVRQGLQEGMENQIAGLRTSGGLTREQAEQEIANIKEQSYQISLLIRDIEDAIYSRNQQMIPLKDQQLTIDKEIRVLQDAIYSRETEIYNIRTKQLEPAAKILESLNTQKTDMQEITDETIDQIEALGDQQLAVNETTKRVDELAKAWHEVQKQIVAANKASKENIDKLGSAPQKMATDILPQNTNIGGAPAFMDLSGIFDLSGFDWSKLNFDMNAGGMVKYASGGNVFGDGTRDSVKAMLTPGEFVVRKAMVDKYGTPMFSAINQGAFDMPKYDVAKSTGGDVSVKSENTTNVVAPMYNNYSVNVNVSNSGASADEIATRAVMKIKQMQNTQIRSSRGY